MYIEIILPIPLKSLFTYFVPTGMELYIKQGVLVGVDFNNQQYVGIVYSISSTPSSNILLRKIKSILSIKSSKPVIQLVQFHFWKWISEYYFCFIGEIFKAAFPSLSNFAVDNKIKLSNKMIKKMQLPFLQLNILQQNVLNKIEENFKQKDICLLHGIPFNDRIGIYANLIINTLKDKKQILLLFPEINTLTKRIILRLKQLFGDKLGVYHSKLNKSTRSEIWNDILNNERYQMILGAHLAIFLPFQSLGLIIIVDEHDSGHKRQNTPPRYNVRDSAIFLGSLYQSKVLLESITPSIETFYNVQIGKYGYVTLEKSFKEIKQPTIMAIDTKELKRKKMMIGNFSPVLIKTIKHQLENKVQVVLLQEQKYTIESIEKEIKTLFPNYSVVRMDSSTSKERKLNKKIKIDFEIKKTNILVGTQIIFKELNLKKLELVGIVSIDSLINSQDFRAYERSYQLFSRIIDLIGEKENKKSTILLQTSHLKNPLINFILRQDYQGMYTSQIKERKCFNYPPFCKLIQITITHKKKEILSTFSTNYSEFLKKKIKNYKVIGPDESLIGKKFNIYFQKILLKIPNNISYSNLYQTLENVYDQFHFHSSIKVIYEVDPI